MKQRITVEQINELSDNQKERLREWWTPKRGDFYFMPNEGEYLLGNASEELNKKSAMRTGALPLLSVGRMIELIGDKQNGNDKQLEITKMYDRDQNGNQHENGWTVKIKFDDHADELCDALWDAVKTVI